MSPGSVAEPLHAATRSSETSGMDAIARKQLHGAFLDESICPTALTRVLSPTGPTASWPRHLERRLTA
jgi:hypothetical protein